MTQLIYSCKKYLTMRKIQSFRLLLILYTFYQKHNSEEEVFKLHRKRIIFNNINKIHITNFFTA